MSDRAPVLKSVYGSGWSPAKKAMLEAVVMPQKTRCSHCNTLKATTPHNFSNRKLEELRNRIANGHIARNPMGKWIDCRTCAGSAPVELECSHCNEWKELKGFTKAQRKDPDNARCIECVADDLDEDPIIGMADWNKKREDDDDSEDEITNYHEDVCNKPDPMTRTADIVLKTEFASESGGGARLSEYDQDDLTNENLHVLNVSTGGQSIKQSASLASTGASIANSSVIPTQATAAGVGKWQKLAGGGPLGAAAGNAFVGYDDQGQAHSQFRTPSTTGSDSDHSTTTMTAEDHDARAEPLYRSNFAKVKGNKGKPSVYRPEKTTNRTVTLNDYDDDDDEVDEGDDYFTY